MEKIKELLTPGKATDDQIMYGSGRVSDLLQPGKSGLSGEGSHFPGSQDTTTSTGAENTTTGPHSSDLANKADPRVDSDLDGSRKLGETTEGLGQADQHSIPGSSPPQSNNPYHAQQLDPRIAGPSTVTADESRIDTSNTKTDTAAQPTITGPGVTAHESGTGISNTRTDTTGQPAITGLGVTSNESGTGISDTRTNTTTQPATVGHSVTDNNDHHLGSDAAAVGVAGAVGEGIHHKQQDERENLASSNPILTSSDPDTSAGVTGTHTEVGASATETTGSKDSNLISKNSSTVGSENPGTVENTGTGHHYGRDAAALGGAAVVGEGIQHRHGNNDESLAASGTTSSGVGPLQSDTQGTAAVADLGPHTTAAANRLDPSINQSALPIDDASHHDPLTGGGGKSADEAHSADTHHLGRDAVIGAGGLGAGGLVLAEHEHRKHDIEPGQNADGAGGSSSTTEPHGETTSRISTTGTGPVSGAHVGDTTRSGATGISGHQVGSDSVIGANTVGIAEHENRKQEDRTVPTDTTSTTANYSSAGGPAPTTTGPHSKDWLNKLDPRVDSKPKIAPAESSSTPVERDAIAGAGLTGAAAYEAEKHHDSTKHHDIGDSSDNKETVQGHHHTTDTAAIGAAGVGTAGVGAHEIAKHHKEHERQNELGSSAAAGADTQPEHSNQVSGQDSAATGTTQDRTSDHHLGRDAAGAGVVGGGLYEAEKHHKHDKDLTAAEKEQKRELKHEEKEAKREHKREEKAAKHEAEVAKHEEKLAKHEHDDEKHQDKKEEKKHHGLLSFLHRDKSKKYSKEEEDEFSRQEQEQKHHTGRDAAIGATAIAGAGYEAEKHHGHHHTGPNTEADTTKPLPVAPGNNGIGTGEGTQNALVIDRKRGEGYDTTSATGHDTTSATGQDVAPATGNDKISTTGNDTTSTTGQDHHYGRDAAAVGGVAAIGEHEHHKKNHGHHHAQETEGFKEPGTLASDRFDGVDSNRVVNETGGTGTNREVGQGGVPEGSVRPHESHLANVADPRVDSDVDGSRLTDTLPGTSESISTADPTGANDLSRDAAIGPGAARDISNEHGRVTGSTPGGAHLPGTAPKHNVLHKDPPANHPAAVGGLTEADTNQDGLTIEGNTHTTTGTGDGAY